MCTTLWEFIPKKKGGLPKHLLWALLFLKTYMSDDILSGMTDTSPKTFRKWARAYVVMISKLKHHVVSKYHILQISLSNRFLITC